MNSSMVGAPARVCVVIPAYNSARFIDETLSSVASQIRPVDEVVVVDDGSVDDTAERAESWASRLLPARLMVLRCSNGGLAVARNRGIMAATADIIAFLDADDVLEPAHLATLVPAFELHPGLSLAFGDMVRWGGIDDGRRVLAPIREELLRVSRPLGTAGLLLLDAGVRAIYLRRRRIAPSSWLVARRAIAEIGLFDTTLRYGEDTEFLFRLLARGTAAWCDAITARKRDHGENMSASAEGAKTEPHIMFTLARIRQFGRDLTPAEAAAIDEGIDIAAREVQYLAAGEGLRSYLRSRQQIASLIRRRAPFVPRQLLRAMAPSRVLQRRERRHQASRRLAHRETPRPG